MNVDFRLGLGISVNGDDVENLEIGKNCEVMYGIF